MEKVSDLHLENIDPRIRSIVEGLNTLGYKTVFSCAGHKGDPEGYIIVEGTPDEIDLRNRLSMLGLHRVSIKKGMSYTTVETTTISFPPLGGSKGGKRLPKFDPNESLRTNEITLVRLFARNLHRLGFHCQRKESVLIRYALSQALLGKEVVKGDMP